ncbi:MAG: hypothetical protein ACKKL6_02965 [Candidatus Komeilibacteria bacterium]
MDINRLGNLIKKTKDKIIVATDTDLLVVMDLDSYEDLVRDNQAKSQFIAKDELKEKTMDIEDEKQALNDIISSEAPIMEPIKHNSVPNGPISVKDVIADRAEASFAPPISNIQEPDEGDEFFFEEIDE